MTLETGENRTETVVPPQKVEYVIDHEALAKARENGARMIIDSGAEYGDLVRVDTLRLSARGREVYGWSYIIFGNDYAKTIWTAIIAGLVIWYASWRLEAIFPDAPQKIQIEYINTSQPLELKG